ncbi:MAG: hypothetical protein AAB666_03860 [Patescibacteria group bacterium]
MDGGKLKNKKPACRHDYKNAIKIGNIDYLCPLCDKLLDPLEWFFMNSFKFVEVFSENKTPAKKGGRIAKNTRQELESKTGKKVVSGENFLQSSQGGKQLK